MKIKRVQITATLTCSVESKMIIYECCKEQMVRSSMWGKVTHCMVQAHLRMHKGITGSLHERSLLRFRQQSEHFIKFLNNNLSRALNRRVVVKKGQAIGSERMKAKAYQKVHGCIFGHIFGPCYGCGLVGKAMFMGSHNVHTSSR